MYSKIFEPFSARRKGGQIGCWRGRRKPWNTARDRKNVGRDEGRSERERQGSGGGLLTVVVRDNHLICAGWKDTR